MVFRRKYFIFFFLLLAGISELKAESFKIRNDTSAWIVSRKAKNVILLIGDGMGVAQIYSGLTANHGKLNFEQFKFIGFSKTYSASNYITDSGAGATALSTGKKTKNGYIGVDTAGKPLKTLLEIAEDNKMSTGLVATSSITHATPASFIAHCADRNDYESIANDFLKTDIDVFIGGGKNNFNKRKDGKDLIGELKKKGYTVTDTITDFVNLKTKRLAGFTAKGHNPSILNGRGEMLPVASNVAIDILSQNKTGFFLMIEGSQIDWGGHDNNTDYITSELIDFDKVIGQVLDFARKDKNTLVIVTADHETGGMAISGGDIKNGNVVAKFSTKDHTGVMVPVFAFGPGAEEFMGIYENNEIFFKIIQALGLENLAE
ncbi:MAG: alkaline phosphatase [Bacteroidales bacterium]